MRDDKVSVLVLNYNGLDYLNECFSSLFKQTYKNYEIFMVDNCSTDGSQEFVKKHFPRVRIIQFKENLGFTGAYNKAIRMLKEDFIALLNNDTKVDRNWLKELMAVIKKDDKIAICASKILFYDKPKLVNSAGLALTQIGSGFDIGFREDASKFNESRFTCASGGALLLRRKAFIDVGGFDPTYFIYFEDTDLSWRLWLYGYRIIFVPTSIVYHKFGAFCGSYLHSPMRIYYGQKNRITNILKNFNMQDIILAFIISVFFDTARIVNFIMKRKVPLIALLFKADMYVVRNIKSILKKRKIVQSNRKISDKELKKLGIILPLKESIKDFFRLYWY